jgi:glycosyltransferase involved in cell wall biosynthesis
MPHRLIHALWGWGCDFVPDQMVASSLSALVQQENYDLIVGRYMWALARSGVMGLRPTLLDVDDFETDVIEAEFETRQPAGLQRSWMQRRLNQVAKVERKILDRCEHVWVAKAGDTKRVGHDRCSVLPNIPFVKAGQHGIDPCPPNNSSKSILIVGTLEHPVNVRAIQAFIDGPWKEIRLQVPDARFQIVGSGMTDTMRTAWSSAPGVEAIGFAEDLRQAYADSAITIVPIREGGGTKIKVLESMLYGRACVCASHSLRGYEHVLEHDRSILVAADDAALVQGCVSLLNDPAKRVAIANEGGRLVREHFSLQRFMDTVLNSVDKVCREGSASRQAL